MLASKLFAVGLGIRGFGAAWKGMKVVDFKRGGLS